MSKNSFNQAIEITKVILQHHPEIILPNPTHLGKPKDSKVKIREITEFIDTMANLLDKIEQYHLQD